MALAGFEAPVSPAPDLSLVSEILEADWSLNNSTILGDSFNGRWWKWTPSAAGVFGFDTFLSTAVDGTQPDSLIVFPFLGDAFAGPDPAAFTMLSSDNEGQRGRFIVQVLEAGVGTPVGIGAYGALLGDDGILPDPILISVRLSALVALPTDLSESTPTTLVVRPNGGSGTQNGHITPDIGLAYGSVLRDIHWGGMAFKECIEDITDGIDCAWALARRSYQGTLSQRCDTAGVNVNPILMIGTGSCPSPLTSDRHQGDFFTDPANSYATGVIAGGGFFSGMTMTGANIHEPGAQADHDPVYLATLGMSGYRSLLLSITAAEASCPSWGVDDTTAPAPDGFLRLYDTDAGLVPQAGVPTLTPRLVALQVAPDEQAVQPSSPDFVLTNSKWYFAGTQETYGYGWGIHWVDPSESTDNGLPMVKFGDDGGLDGPNDLGSIQTLISTYAGGAAGPYVSMDSTRLAAARAHERDLAANYPAHARFGLSFTNLGVAVQSNTPTTSLDHAALVAETNIGRADQVLAFKMTFAQRYVDIPLPELVDPIPPTIDNAFDLARCRFV